MPVNRQTEGINDPAYQEEDELLLYKKGKKQHE